MSSTSDIIKGKAKQIIGKTTLNVSMENQGKALARRARTKEKARRAEAKLYKLD